MVDVSEKSVTVRTATAGCYVTMAASTAAVVRAGDAKKGDVLSVARLAAIMATKQTAVLIPLCHSIPIEKVAVRFGWEDAPDDSDWERLWCEVEVRTTGKTGVEMEAMTGASVAGLTVYDMLKSVQRDISIGEIRLIAKSGGKSGVFFRE